MKTTVETGHRQIFTIYTRILSDKYNFSSEVQEIRTKTHLISNFSKIRYWLCFFLSPNKILCTGGSSENISIENPFNIVNQTTHILSEKILFLSRNITINTILANISRFKKKQLKDFCIQSILIRNFFIHDFCWTHEATALRASTTLCIVAARVWFLYPIFSCIWLFAYYNKFLSMLCVMSFRIRCWSLRFGSGALINTFFLLAY